MPPSSPGKKPVRKGPPNAWVPSRPDPRGAAPATLADVLVGTEEIFAQRSGSAIRRAEWTSIVGPRISARTRVGKLQKGILTVKVASSSWSNELSFLKGQLIEKLKRAGHEVNDLRFRVDQIADDLAQKKNHPMARRPGPQAADVPLPDELLERLKTVDDLNLRAVIAEAARASFASNKKP